jgi:hypothetical protein
MVPRTGIGAMSADERSVKTRPEVEKCFALGVPRGAKCCFLSAGNAGQAGSRRVVIPVAQKQNGTERCRRLTGG